MDMAMVITTISMISNHQHGPFRHPARLRLLSQCIGLLLIAVSSANGISQVMQSSSNGGNSLPSNNVPVPNIVEPGDLLTVTVFNTPELSGALRVDPHGNISLPVGGLLQVSGLTPAEASNAIENRLRTADIMLDPHISVLITQFGTQGVTILGEVKNPGIYPVRGSFSLYDALSMAGGPTAAEGGDITISHRDNPERPFTVQVNSPNYSSVQRLTSVLPGDTVLVSKASSIFIVGDVRAPGQYPMPYGKQLTILNILALTQGLNVTADSSKAAIVRATLDGGAETIPVDLNKVMRNQAPNIVLEAFDVLVIPRSGFKSFTQFALPALTNGAVSAGVSAAIVR